MKKIFKKAKHLTSKAIQHKEAINLTTLDTHKGTSFWFSPQYALQRAISFYHEMLTIFAVRYGANLTGS